MSRKPGANASKPLPKPPKDQNHTSAAMTTQNAASAPVFATGTEALKTFGIPQRDLCKATGLSLSAINRICVHGEWPAFGAGPALEQIDAYLVRRGLTHNQQRNVLQALHKNKLAPVISNTTEAVPLSPETETAKEEPMLLRHLRLSRQACDHFKIIRDPFVDELHGMDDVFITDGIRDVRAALRQTAKFGGMLAVVGEVGSGKSILRRDLHEWINQGNEPITVIEPYVTNMEDNDTRGKNLRAKDIEGTVIRALDPHTRLAANTQDRTLQMHKLLKASAKLGQKHVIVVEEAHALSIPTLKHLKRLYELDDGFRRLLGIILIGQTELEFKLSERNAEVREMVGRCAVVHVSALDNHVGAYLRHKFERVGLDAAALIAPDAIEEITARLRQTVSETWGGKRVQREQSLCYPLAINNLLTRAMNEAVKIGAAKVTAGLIVAATREVRT
jgi:type II secretory pathway predicted ATPase ExeA